MATNFLKLNESKTELLDIGRFESPIKSLFLDGTEIFPASKAKNLGFMIDDQLTLEA